METHNKNPSLPPVLVAALSLMLAGRVSAQTFMTLYTFSGGSDGAGPQGDLISSTNTLYGTTANGGDSGVGTVFSVNIDGTSFTVLHSFTAVDTNAFNSDGAYPRGRLLLSSNTLYGVTEGGGSSGNGVVFAMNIDGASFAVLHTFSATTNGFVNSDGARPSGLVLSSHTLYGTAFLGGSSGLGTVFALNTDGTGFTNIYTFSPIPVGSATNSDGGEPLGGLALFGSTLYGTASMGGSFGYGTVFALNTNGTGFRTLHSFTHFGADGDRPTRGLVLSGSTLYGTATYGANPNNGTVFKVNTNGTGFTTLHVFSPAYYNGSTSTNTDGANPPAGLILSGNTLYGAAYIGGLFGDGTVFALSTAGTGFTTLYNFTAVSCCPQVNADGASPEAGLTLSGNMLYGTTFYGGTSGNGTIFSISLPTTGPQLTITPFGPSVVLRWPTNYAGFTLQSATDLSSPVWTTNLPAPVVVSGQNTVTNPISGQKFFRLIGN